MRPPTLSTAEGYKRPKCDGVDFQWIQRTFLKCLCSSTDDKNSKGQWVDTFIVIDVGLRRSNQVKWALERRSYRP